MSVCGSGSFYGVQVISVDGSKFYGPTLQSLEGKNMFCLVLEWQERPLGHRVLEGHSLLSCWELSFKPELVGLK